MPKFATVLNSFQYGELSPKFLARTDTEQFQKGLAKLENMISLPSGGASRRPGTVYVDKATTGFHRIIPFIFSKTEAYYLWLVGLSSGKMYVHIYTPAGVLDASPIDSNRLPTSAHPQGSGIGLNLDFGSSNPITQEQMDNIQFVQSGDLVFCTMTPQAPFVIARTGLNTFTLSSYLQYAYNHTSVGVNFSYPAFRDVNTTATTITPSGTSGSVTLTASVGIFDPAMVASDPSGYGATYIKITHGSTTGIAQITAYSSATVVTALVFVNFGATTASDNWQESAWSDYRGWPESVGLFESRLIFGGSKSQPDTVWGSLCFNLLRFMPNVLAQDASSDVSGLDFFGSQTDLFPFAFTPTAREINRIGWIQSGKTLTIGTLGQEFVATGNDQQSRVLSASSVSFTDQTTIGSAPIQAIRVNKETIFVSRDGKRIYGYSYDNFSQNYIADNMTALSEHIVTQSRLDEEESLDADALASPALTDFISAYGVKSLHWHNSRSVLWAVTTSGDLIGCTWDPQVKALSWHRHIFGGHFDDAQTKRPFVLSAAVVPAEDGLNDCLGILVQRSINGATVTTFEIIGSDFSSHRLDYSAKDFTLGECPVFADLAIEKVLSPASTTVTGLDHLKGQDVEILADGFARASGTVDSNTGTLELDSPASFVIIGLKYTPRIKLPPLTPESPLGSSMGMMSRVDRMTIRFYRTLSAIVTGSEDREIVGFRPGNLPMGAPIPLFTGDKKIDVRQGPERRIELEITQDQPLPMTVLGISLRGSLNE